MFTAVIYSLLLVIACYGCVKVKTDFNMTFFIDEDAYVYEFFSLKDEYFNAGFRTTFYINDPDIDYSSPEIQRQIIEFEDSLKRSREC